MEDFKQSLTENSYTRQEELTFGDCDRYRRARVGTLLRKIGAFAGYDYDARGWTYEKLYERREVFLLSRVALKIHDCPHARDVLTITTWENGAKGAHMQRVFEMADSEGRVRVSAKSDWILVDPVTRKILRPGSFTAKPLTTCPKEIDCPETGRIALPGEGVEALGSRAVVWSDLDGNGHFHSGGYGDVVWDYLPEDLQERTPREFYLNYSKEALLGQELHLTGVRTEDGYLMEGEGPDGLCFAARCVF